MKHKHELTTNMKSQQCSTKKPVIEATAGIVAEPTVSGSGGLCRTNEGPKLVTERRTELTELRRLDGREGRWRNR